MKFKRITSRNAWCFQKLMIYLQPRSNLFRKNADLIEIMIN